MSCLRFEGHESRSKSLQGRKFAEDPVTKEPCLSSFKTIINSAK